MKKVILISALIGAFIAGSIATLTSADIWAENIVLSEDNGSENEENGELENGDEENGDEENGEPEENGDTDEGEEPEENGESDNGCLSKCLSKCYSPKINRETEAIEDGVRITITSDNEEIVERLQCQEEGSITYTVIHTDDGIEIKITSDNEEITEELQEWIENGHKFLPFGFLSSPLKSLFSDSNCHWWKGYGWIDKGFGGRSPGWLKYWLK